MNPDVILHIPHSEPTIPPEVRGTFLLDDAGLDREILVMTDWYTDELFAMPDAGVETIRFPVSRLVVDPERFVEDDREPMATQGMGVIYTRTSDGRVLREAPQPSERDALLAQYYAPHHRRLWEATGKALAVHGHALILDCHSFPSQSLPCHAYQGQGTPDICLGTDEFHTPQWLLKLARRVFGERGYSVSVDWPFSGTLVPQPLYRRTPGVLALMLEANRRCYMNERDGTRLPEFDAVAAGFQAMVLQIVGEARAKLAAQQPLKPGPGRDRIAER